MESYHFVGLITVIVTIIFWLIVVNRIDRIEDKINKLLKTQTESKKPKNIRKWHDEYVGDCPSCNRVVRFAQKHCNNCTRLLDWSEVLEFPTDDDDDDE